jgi:mono/diheme cytochrome c family protein
MQKNTMRRFAVGCALGAMAMLAGCRQDMQDQPKMIPQRGSEMFADGRSARPQVEGTVARGQLHEDSYFYSGMIGTGATAKPGDLMPFPVSMTVVERGQERFNTYCTPCHSRVGNGEGAIVERGYARAGNLQDEEYIAKPLGHYFDVMTHGFGAMPDYSAQLSPADRWAVAAYIRALQLSQHAKPEDVPAGIEPKTLAEIAKEEGMPASLAGEWKLPATAVNVDSVKPQPATK